MNPSRKSIPYTASRTPPSFGLMLSTTSSLACIVEPPNLSSISDANTVVILKNLSKKDENTKSKALEDLQSRLKTVDLDEAVVTVWVQLYPRLSIDNSRRVRQLSNTLLGFIGWKIGKKMAKHMPKIVGSWLSGLYDPDRSVQKATRDSLVSVFNSEDKIKSLWTVYEGTILEYCKETIVNESIYTLSDERSVSPDDADAKYSRVMGTCWLIIEAVLSTHEFKEKFQLYSAVVAHKPIWNFMHHSDAFLRRSTYKFLQAILNKDLALVQANLKTICACIIVKAPAYSQIGSIESYLDTLVLLTTKLPESWYMASLDKKAPIHPFLVFLEKGSNLSPPIFWEKIAIILTNILSNPLYKVTSVQDCIAAITKPLLNGQEPQSNLPAAWKCYFTVSFKILAQHSLDCISEDFLLNESLFSIFKACVNSEDTQLQFFSHADGWKVCASGLSGLQQCSDEVQQKFVSRVWHRLESEVVDRDSTNNLNILKNGKGWVKLCAECIAVLQPDTLIYSTIQKSIYIVLSQTTDSLDLSKGDNPDAARLFEDIMQYGGCEIYKYPETKNRLAQFFNKTIHNLLGSPSIENLLGAFVIYGINSQDQPTYQLSWDRLINGILTSPLNKHKKELSVQIIMKLGSEQLSHKIQSCTALDEFVINDLNSLLTKNTEEKDWKIIKHSVASSGALISNDVLQNILRKITMSLTQADSSNSRATVQMLEVISGVQSHTLYLFMSSRGGKELLTRLLTLSNSSDGDLSIAAEAAQTVVWKVMLSNIDHSQIILEVIVEVISDSVQQFQNVNTSLEYLIMITQETFVHANEIQKIYLTEHLLFSEEQWKYALQSLLRRRPDISVAAVNPLGGCIFLVNDICDSTVATKGPLNEQPGSSSALRMAIFAMRLVCVIDAGGWTIPIQLRAFILYAVCLIQEFAQDKTSISDMKGLWKYDDPKGNIEVHEFLGDFQQWMNKCMGFGNMDNLSTLALQCFCRNSKDLSPIAFYSARGLVALLTNLGAQNLTFYKSVVEWLEPINFRNINDTFWKCAIFVGLRDSMKVCFKEKICDNLIVSISAITTLQINVEGLSLLVMLNSILPTFEEVLISVPQPRIITLIKAVLHWLDADTEDVCINTGLLTEVSNILSQLLPLVKSMYGEHWQLTLNFIKNCWEGSLGMNNEDIPLLISTLRLFESIRCLLGANEDVDDAWNTFERDLYQMLLKLLQQANPHDHFNKPRKICNKQIYRQLRDIKSSLIDDLGALYSMVRIQSKPIQQAAFDILHREIPRLQEQVSIAYVASAHVDSEVALPAEILSLIIEAPQLPEHDIDLPTDEYITIRGYLLSWILVYDHFENAILNLKKHYSDILKNGKYVPLLLNYICGHLFSKGRNYDAMKIDITHYVSETWEDPSQDLRTLEIHVYYLALRHTPNLVKSWWLDCSNRSMVLAVEIFTERFMSPLLVDHELTTVSEWAQTRDTSDDLVVKVAKVAKEVTVSYPIDDQFLEIVVRLPGTFPLRLVEIKGLRRVGLKEDHFQQLLRASQAVVNFQSGTIIDAISLFQKNVSLHFQGIIECAICYSILAVTPDRALPKRACSTCKNKFHSTCLLKWFKTSGSSSCPLCRTSISFYT